MAVTHRATTTNTEAGSLTINTPAGTAAGDLLVAMIGQGVSTSAIAAPTGWYKLSQYGGAACFVRQATASEPASHTWNLSFYTNGGIISAFTGVDPVHPVDGLVPLHRGSTAAFGIACPPTAQLGSGSLLVFCGVKGLNTSYSVTSPATKAGQYGVSVGENTHSGALAYEALSASGWTTGRSISGGAASATAGFSLTLSPPRDTNVLRCVGARNSYEETVPRPPFVREGDLLVAQVLQGTKSAYTVPSGWTTVFDVDVPGTNTPRALQFRRWVAASEPESYSFSSFTNTGIVAFAGVDPAEPIQASGSATGSTGAPTSPSVTPPRPGMLALAAADEQEFYDDYTYPYTLPSGTQPVFFLRANYGTNALAVERRPAGGATGSRTFARSGDYPWAGLTTALKEPGGGYQMVV